MCHCSRRTTTGEYQVIRFIDFPDNLHYSIPETDSIRKETKQTSYQWTRKEIQNEWVSLADEDGALYRSPKMAFQNIREIDRIEIRIDESLPPVPMGLLWNEKEILSPEERRKQARYLAANSHTSGLFLIKGENIAENQSIESIKFQKPIHYIFLQFPSDQPMEFPIDSIRVISKKDAYSNKPCGKDRYVVGGEIRDVLYTHTPAPIQFTTNIPANAELTFGVYHFNSAPVQYTIEIGDNPQAERLFYKSIQPLHTWCDFRIDLKRFSGNQVITLRAESESDEAIVFWANPTIVNQRNAHTGPNVILYLVDTLRADHLGCYGYQSGTSPFLDQLASKGVLFERCFSQSPWTKPSIPTLLASLYPHTHRVGVKSYTDILPDSVETLQDVMRRDGCVTANFTANPLGSALSNLDQGFDYTFNPSAFEITNRVKKNDQLHSDDLNKRILPWLETHAENRFFIYIHSMDPHNPYSAPIRPSHLNNRNGPMESYDAEIYFNDSQIKKLYEKLIKLGLEKDTLFIVTSDHGEAFSEHGNVHHGHSVYNEEIHVPLLMIHPGALQPQRIETPAQLVDVMPTILSHCCVEYDPMALQGKALLPLKNARNSRSVFSSRICYESFFHSLIQGDCKLIYNPSPTDEEIQYQLFNLAKDPGEQNNLAERDPQRTQKMIAELKEFLLQQERLQSDYFRQHYHSISSPPDQALSQDDIERLKALGYIQ